MTSDNQQPPNDLTELSGPEGDNEMGGLESAEQYMRAHELIERLRADRRPSRDGGDEQDARLSATAAMLHAAAPESGEIDSLFAASLFDRLQAAQAAHETQPGQVEALPQPSMAAQPEPAAAEHARPPRVGVTRRGLLLGGLGATAAAVAGAAVTSALEQPRPAGGGSSGPSAALSPEGSGAWVAIATLAEVPLGAVKRFEAGAIIGYVQHTASGFVALSGVCTHMACLLQWNAADRTFDCPCHGGRFLANGQSAPGGRYAYAPLPPIQTKVEGEQVLVYVAGASAGPQSGAYGSGSGGYGPSASAKATPR